MAIRLTRSEKLACWASLMGALLGLSVALLSGWGFWGGAGTAAVVAAFLWQAMLKQSALENVVNSKFPRQKG